MRCAVIFLLATALCVVHGAEKKAYFQITHLSPDAGPVVATVIGNGGEIKFENLKKDQTVPFINAENTEPFEEVVAGMYNIKVTLASTGQSIYDGQLDLSEDTQTTVLILGKLASLQPLMEAPDPLHITQSLEMKKEGSEEWSAKISLGYYPEVDAETLYYTVYCVCGPESVDLFENDIRGVTAAVSISGPTRLPNQGDVLAAMVGLPVPVADLKAGKTVSGKVGLEAVAQTNLRDKTLGSGYYYGVVYADVPEQPGYRSSGIMKGFVTASESLRVTVTKDPVNREIPQGRTSVTFYNTASDAGELELSLGIGRSAFTQRVSPGSFYETSVTAGTYQLVVASPLEPSVKKNTGCPNDKALVFKEGSHYNLVAVNVDGGGACQVELHVLGAMAITANTASYSAAPSMVALMAIALAIPGLAWIV